MAVPVRKNIALMMMLIAVFLHGSAFMPFTPNKDCNNIKVEHKADPKDASRTLFDVSIEATGGQSPFHYILMDKGDNIVSFDNTKNRFDNLKPGTYRCTVVDGQNCRKDLSFEVK